jgi:hypothetical protein
MNLNFFKTRNLSRASASLPSMSVIGSAQPDVVKIKVYVRKIIMPFFSLHLIIVFRNRIVTKMIQVMNRVHQKNYVLIHDLHLIEQFNV